MMTPFGVRQTSALWLTIILGLLLLLMQSSEALLSPALAEPECKMERALRMIGYDCADRRLKEVPTYMKSDVEILDLSVNRLRDLTLQSFERYESIKFLYMQENSLQSIEANTFARLQCLEAIDLSDNAITTIPKELFALPALRILRVAGNNLQHLTYDLTLISKPIQAPLELISVAHCKLQNVPEFGILPDLITLNISQNALTSLTPESFAPFCSLQIVDLNHTVTPRCSCHLVTKYLADRHIRIHGDVRCDDRHQHLSQPHSAADSLNILEYCAEKAKDAVYEESAAFAECAALVKEREVRKQTRSTWMWIMIGLIGFLVVFMGILYGLHRRNVNASRMSKVAKNRRPPTDGAGPSAVASAVRLPVGDVTDGNDDGLLQQTTKV